MADFISALTGVQMDAALLDMAEHNSEAYAVGERNGIAVASDDVTYHNNARYYAQIASSQIVGDASSAVRWDTDQSEALTDAQKAQARENINAASDSDVVKITAQTLTSAEQAQARANIMAGGSNPNLLDNPFFTVRQRGNGPFTGADVTGIDRWKTTNSNATITGNDGYITLTAASGGNAFLVQYTDTEYEGTYTYSAYIRGSGGGYVGVTNADRSAVLSSKTFDNVGNNWTLISGTVTTSGDGIGTFTIRVNAGTSIDIKCVKLELGSVFTLANDAPPDYAEELAKCQYYCRVIEGNTYTAIGQAVASTSVRFPMPFVMRVKPSISVSGSVQIYGNGGMLTVSSITVNGKGNTVVELICAVSGATSHTTYLLLPASEAKIILSADL